MSKPTACSLQQLFQAHWGTFAASRALHPRELRAGQAISECFTQACGSHLLRCPNGHVEQLQLHGCRHRCCPRCAGRPRQLWLEAALARLLPCPHFHVVFTLPHELLGLWQFNRRALTALFMRCVRSCLLQLMADPVHLGVLPALVMALHTWGRNLSAHPHIHCLVSAGGITPSGRWKSCFQRFLLPLPALRQSFSAALLDGITLALLSQRLHLPPSSSPEQMHALLVQLRSKHWNIQIQHPYSHARGLACYLARYVKGGPVPSSRALSIDSAGIVRMPYLCHRSGCTKTLSLPVHAFIERLLWHAPDRGVHHVRYAGLYNSSNSASLLAARTQLRDHSPPSPPAGTPHPPALDSTRPRCPTCQATLLALHQPRRLHQTSAFSYRHCACTAAASTAVPPGPTHRSTGPPTAGPATRPAYHPTGRASRLRPVS